MGRIQKITSAMCSPDSEEQEYVNEISINLNRSKLNGIERLGRFFAKIKSYAKPLFDAFGHKNEHVSFQINVRSLKYNS